FETRPCLEYSSQIPSPWASPSGAASDNRNSFCNLVYNLQFTQILIFFVSISWIACVHDAVV
ncbi:hypothetical protein BgiBS90_010067, partial [Biomphalaria glabrata]